MTEKELLHKRERKAKRRRQRAKDFKKLPPEERFLKEAMKELGRLETIEKGRKMLHALYDLAEEKWYESKGVRSD